MKSLLGVVSVCLLVGLSTGESEYSLSVWGRQTWKQSIYSKLDMSWGSMEEAVLPYRSSRSRMKGGGSYKYHTLKVGILLHMFSYNLLLKFLE